MRKSTFILILLAIAYAIFPAPEILIAAACLIAYAGLKALFIKIMLAIANHIHNEHYKNR